MRYRHLIAIVALFLLLGALTLRLLAQNESPTIRRVAQETTNPKNGVEAVLAASGFKQFSHWLSYTNPRGPRLMPNTTWELVVDHTNPDNMWNQTFPGVRNGDPCYVWFNENGVWVGDQKAYDKLEKAAPQLGGHHHHQTLLTVSSASGAACTLSHYSTYVPGTNYGWLFVCP